MICKMSLIGGRWVCGDCGGSIGRASNVPPKVRCPMPAGRRQGPTRDLVGSPQEPLRVNDLSQGPCVHRGPLVAIERCQIGCRRNKRIETFACLPDAGCAGAPLVASEEQWSHAQTLNRRRVVCRWCARYEPPVKPSESEMPANKEIGEKLD